MRIRLGDNRWPRTSQSGRAAILLLCAAALSISLGCGGGGGGGVSSANAVVQTNETAFSQDAVILAASRAQGPWIPASDTKSIDADLKRIRAKVSVLELMHARGDFVLTDFSLGVKSDATWTAGWRAGGLTTGNAAVDSFFAQYNLVRVETYFEYDGTAWFLLKFAQSLNAKALIDPARKLSPDIQYPEVNGYGGDGDEITLSEAGGVRTYTFSHGWGDCPSGCIQRHSWTVTVGQDGTIHVAESGSPLDPGDFPPSRAAASTTPAMSTRAALRRAGRAP